MVSTGCSVWGCDPRESAFFHAEIRVLIYVGRPNRFVTEPEPDDCTVHSCVQQLHGATVPEHVRCDPLGCKGGAGGCSGGRVPIDDAPDGVPAETLAMRPRKQWVARLTAALAKPVT